MIRFSRLKRIVTPLRRRRRSQGAAPESLELRALLSVTHSFDNVTGEFEVSTDADDAITVSAGEAGDDVLVNGAGTGVNPDDVTSLEVSGSHMGNRLDVSAVNGQDFSGLTSVVVRAGGGDDTVTGSELDDDIIGGSGNDNIDGGSGNDQIRGDSGDDSIQGGPGDDSIGAHTGNDDIMGGDGDDTIGAGGGNDAILGQAGRDVIRAGSGHDRANGGADEDDIFGGGGRDQLKGGAAADLIRGQNGSDVIEGNDGDDEIRGNRGKDELDGGAGADSLKGGSSDDLIKGGADNDSLDGGRGDDLLDGDEGDDDEQNGFSTDVESTFLALLSNQDGLTGEASFERDVEGDIELEFEVEVQGGTAGTYDVMIGEVTVGQLVVDESGEGSLELSTEPDDAGEGQLPSNFPEIVDGTAITIGSLAGGTFQQYEDMELDATLSPVGASFGGGAAEFEADGPMRFFSLEINDVTPGTYDLIIGGVVVDSITVVESTQVVEYDDEDIELAFPENFPELAEGVTIELEGQLTGQF